MSGELEKLITDGFLFEGTSLRGFNLTANYGDGFREGACIGSPDGLRTWKLKIALLPDLDDYLVNAGEFGLQTRARYLWECYARHNVANASKPFWVKDPFLKRWYLAEFVEPELDFAMLCATAYSTGLTVRQRRVPGVESPSDVIETENNAQL